MQFDMNSHEAIHTGEKISLEFSMLSTGDCGNLLATTLNKCGAA